jgi:DNA-binding beta-propeller fold protein YncE
MDREMGALYIGHLTVSVNSKVEGGGVSTIDICHPEQGVSPRFAGQSKVVFPDQISQAVIGLSEILPLKSDLRVFATARYSSEISGMVFRFPPDACKREEGAPAKFRDLSLIPSDSFLSSAFLPYGKDIRGVLFSTDENTAYVLHRNASENTSNPSALVSIDRRRQPDGSRANRPLDILKLCNGPTAMKYYPAEGESRRIFVTCYDEGQIYVVDPDAWQVDAIIDVGMGPNSLIFPKGQKNIAYVASYAGNHVAVLDLDPQSPTRNRVVQRLGLPHGNSE